MVKLSTVQTYFNVVYILGPVSVFLATMVLVIIESGFFFKGQTPDLDSSVRVLQWVQWNLQQPAINDISLVTESGGCPKDSLEAPLWTFPGTKAGCSCPATVTLGGCPTTTSGCSAVSAIASKSFPFWMANVICYKLLTLGIQLKDPAVEICPAGYTACSKIMCVPPNVQCPITSIQIVDATTVLPDGYTKIETGQPNKVMHIGRNFTSTFSIKIDAEPNSPPCYDTATKPATPASKTHPLYDDDEDGCSSLGPDLINNQIIQTSSLDDYYLSQTQYISNSLVPTFGNYIAGQTAVLYNRRRIYVREVAECQSIDFSRVSEVNDLISSLNSFMTVILSIALGFYLATLLLLVAYVYRVIRSKELTVSHFPLVLNLVIWCVLIILMIKGSRNYVARRKYNEVIGYFTSIAANKCLNDPQLNSVLNSVANSIPSYVSVSLDLSLANLIISSSASGAFLIFYFAMFCFYRYRKDHFDYDDNQSHSRGGKYADPRNRSKDEHLDSEIQATQVSRQISARRGPGASPNSRSRTNY